MNYANCHLHSTYSDGGFTPTQLVRIAKSLGYGGIVLTDHENDAGCPELLEAAAVEGLEAMTGAEFYGTYNKHWYHIVALDYDMTNHEFRKFIEARRDGYVDYTRRCVERASRLGLIGDVTWSDILDYCEDDMWICVDQVMSYLRQIKFVSRGGDVSELRKQIFRSGEVIGPGYADAKDVIRVIRDAGGIAVLAHPYKQCEYIEELVELGLNGIEVSHPDIDPDDYFEIASKTADEYKLYRSGGTDHTGPLSCCGGIHARPVWHGATEDEFRAMKERRLG